MSSAGGGFAVVVCTCIFRDGLTRRAGRVGVESGPVENDTIVGDLMGGGEMKVKGLDWRRMSTLMNYIYNHKAIFAGTRRAFCMGAEMSKGKGRQLSLCKRPITTMQPG